MTRGFVAIPSGSHYWGASGVFQNRYNADDIIEIKYFLSNPGDTDLAADFLNIGITKL